MFSRPNLALVAAFGFAAATIYLVHYSQNKEREVSERLTLLAFLLTSFLTQRMRVGVDREIERQRRKEENERLLREQLALHSRLEARDKAQQ